MRKGQEVWLMLKGAAMGIAEVIPGVSGGTIAFITGIYEDLIESIKSFHPRLISLAVNGQFMEIARVVKARFLLFLLLGMGLGLVIGVFGISRLIETDPEMLWGFFFGLIIASAIYIGKQVTHWTPVDIIVLGIGFAVATLISFVSPAEGSSHPLMVFIAGFIAISAMLLPGISGSFILLLLGMYTLIIPSLKNFLSSPGSKEGIILLIFAAGCLAGLATFSRILSWTFKHHKNKTLVILTGFMLGSLFKIWPWRNPVLWMDKVTGEKYSSYDEASTDMVSSENLRLLQEINVSPSNYYAEPNTLIVILAAIVGISLVLILGFRQKNA